MAGTCVAALDLAVDPAAWAELGFAVDDDGGCRAGATLLRLGASGTGVSGWVLRGAPGGTHVDGIATAWTDAPPAPPAEHPNRVVAVDHVVVATPDVDRTFAALAAAGMTLKRERAARGPDRPLRQGFFRHGECIVEVVGPQEPNPAERDRPASLWGLTLVVADIDAVATLLGERLGTVRDAVQPGRRIATVRREALPGVPVALITP
jgi:hypothetical protein